MWANNLYRSERQPRAGVEYAIQARVVHACMHPTKRVFHSEAVEAAPSTKLLPNLMVADTLVNALGAIG